MKDSPAPSAAEIKKIEEGMITRELKYKYMATLVKKVR